MEDMSIKLPVDKFGVERMKDGSEEPKEAHHRRLLDWEPYDEITMTVVPKYKLGGLSGSEWQTTVKMEFRFKGKIVAQFMPRSMRTAIMILGAAWISESGNIPEEMLELEKQSCDQPGCKKEGTNKFVLKKLASRADDYLDMSRQYLLYYRQFCDEHVKRGCGKREDCDSNYEPIGDLFSRETIEAPKIGISDVLESLEGLEVPEAPEKIQNPTVLVSAIDMDELVGKKKRTAANGKEQVYSWHKKSGRRDS